MKILVTGGAGYIGSVLVHKLVSLNHEVVVVDDLSTGIFKNLNSNASFIEGSITNIGILKKALKGTDSVIHLAAKKSVEEGQLKPEYYYEQNVEGSKALINLCGEHNIKKFIFASTAAVYGNTEISPITELEPAQPIGIYGKTKLEIDNYLDKFSRHLGITSISFRFFNVIGAVQDSSKKWLEINRLSTSSLIDNVLKSSKLEPVLIYGDDWPTPDKTPIRDFVHVSDIAQALVLSLGNYSSLKHEVINLGTQHGYSVLDVIQTAEKALQSKVYYNFSNRRKGDIAISIASNSKAKDKIGWEPSKNLLEALQDSISEIEYYRKFL